LDKPDFGTDKLFTSLRWRLLGCVAEMIAHYTDTELKTLLKSLVILVDTREQANQHILDYFTKKKIPYLSKKLDYGDYSAFIPANAELGILRDMYFTDTVCIERKNSLDELSNNLTADRARFESELIRANGCKILLMIENSSYDDIVNHRYKSQYEPKSYIATLHTFSARYNLNVNFISSACAGNFVYYSLLYAVRCVLLGR
jgi:ERCC4-type nuclease